MNDAPRLWTPLQRLTQSQVAASADMIGAAADLATDIRYLYVFQQPAATSGRAADIIRLFGRAMIHLDASGVRLLVAQLRSEGFIVKTGLSVLAGMADEVLRRSEALARRSALPAGMSAIPAGQGLDDGDVARIQEMQLASGLVPMPAAAIRDPRACGILLRDPEDQAVGFASLLPLASGRQRQGHHLVNGVVIDPAWRCRGLGVRLTAMTIAQSRGQGAEAFLSSVDIDNGPSVAMQRACGLDRDESQAFIFARISEEDEAALLGGKPGARPAGA